MQSGATLCQICCVLSSRKAFHINQFISSLINDAYYNYLAHCLYKLKQRAGKKNHIKVFNG